MHAYHCLDTVREEIMCNADDTPVPAFSNHANIVGAGQTRMCRRWKDVMGFASKYTTCYASTWQRKPGQDAFSRCDGGQDGIAILDG